jgi:hypothetical protein
MPLHRHRTAFLGSCAKIGHDRSAFLAVAHPVKRTKLVELFGLPGAGKTTLAGLASRNAGAVTRNELSAWWNSRSLLRRSARLSGSCFRLDRLEAAVRLAIGCRLTAGESLWRLLRIVARAEMIRSHDGPVLLDQGLLQELWSILAAAGRTDIRASELEPFVRSLYSGIDVRILFVDVEIGELVRRISQRAHGHSRFDGLGERDLRDNLVRADGLCRSIIEAAALARLPVETMDGSHPAERSLATIRSAVE